MNDYGIVTAPRTIRMERLLPGPIERVWSYLTESEKRRTWLAAGPMELRAGGAVRLTFRHEELSAERRQPQGREECTANDVVGRVIRCEPPRLLTFTWTHAPTPESEVTFELSTEGAKVRLILTHRRLADREEMVGAAGGWHAHLAILEDRLSDAVPRPFWTTHSTVAAEYERRFPAA